MEGSLGSRIPRDWAVATLSEIARKDGAGFVDGPFGSNLPASSYQATGIPVLRGCNLSLGERRFNDEAFVFVSPNTAQRLSRSLCRGGDIIFTKKGTLGQTAIVPLKSKYDLFLLSSNQMKLSVDSNLADPLYVYYFVSAPKHRAKIIRDSEATGVPKTNLAYLRNFPIALPPLREQRAIAHILGALDDKIELNRRMNQTLEATARAIFKSWFVDFDPVQDGHPLFPKAFANSTDTLIPEDWTLGQLGDIVEVIDCLHSKKPERRPTGKPLLQLGNILGNGLLDMSDTYLISPEDYELWISRMEAREGDCVITNVGRVGAVAQIPPRLQAALGRNMTGLRCRSEFPYPTFLIESLLSSVMKEEISRKTDSGTILDSLNVRSIPRLRLLIPTTPVAREFEKLCRPVRAKMESNLEESRTLAALRDTLLPKLLSGEIRVKQAEKIVGEAM